MLFIGTKANMYIEDFCRTDLSFRGFPEGGKDLKNRTPLFISFIGIFIIGSIVAAIGAILTNTDKEAPAIHSAAEGASSYGIRYLAIGITAAFIISVLVRSRKKKL